MVKTNRKQKENNFKVPKYAHLLRMEDVPLSSGRRDNGAAMATMPLFQTTAIF